MRLSFAVTWDYRCPFARNAHEHVLAGLASGADWDVRFVPFSLSQAHVQEGEPSVWEKPEQDKGIVALQAGIVVRDRDPGLFRAVHAELFAARHDRGLHLEDPAVVRDALSRAGADADAVLAAVSDGSALRTVAAEHEAAVADSHVWGVPTFVVGARAVFVRLMNRAAPEDPAASVVTVERVVGLLTDWPELNEFKHTVLPR
jgi:hypothetical protein